MNILITGGTGFIGQHLVEKLLDEGHRLILLCRDFNKTKRLYGSQPRLISRFHEVTTPIDVVINLAGEPIMGRRWSRRRKKQLRGSRVELTRHLVKWMSDVEHKPKLLISGSAIGFYGDHPEGEALDEYGKTRDCFPSQLCSEWEFEALKARALGVRVCLLRTGVVLDKHAGALKKMWTPFSMGLGGRVASGDQWFSWIHIRDMIALIEFLMNNESVEGPVNATAPKPVQYDEFTQTLASKLSRPHWFPMPAFILKLLFGESSELLTEGQNVVPSVLLNNGFTFEFENIDKALQAIVTEP